jgi:hypothetical protein
MIIVAVLHRVPTDQYVLATLPLRRHWRERLGILILPAVVLVIVAVWYLEVAVPTPALRLGRR